MARKSARQLWADKIQGKSTSGAKRRESGFLRPPYKGIMLGIDPSLRGTGLAVIEFGERERRLLLHSRTVKMRQSVSVYDCLGEINRNVSELLDTYRIEAVAVEETIYVQNVQTAQTLGAARGAAIAAVALAKKPVFEYAPLRIKQAVVGVGRASKEQVARTIRNLLGISAALEYDQSDAAAVAICHAFTHIPDTP